tara:strand:- start:20578 stop:20730 length:153 start_codon:yes stop_codon:yes gene_type:complete
MIELSPEDIREFQHIIREEYGMELSDEEAREQGTRLVQFAALICKSKSKK